MLSLDDPRLGLNDLLTRYKALTVSKEPASQPAQAQQEVIVGAFDQLTRDVIRPAMERIGTKLERRGHEYEILIVPGQQITMRFYPPVLPRSAYTPSCCPYVSLSGDASTARIHIVQSTLMPNGQGCTEVTDSLHLDQVTQRYVETQICNVLGKILGTAKG